MKGFDEVAYRRYRGEVDIQELKKEYEKLYVEDNRVKKALNQVIRDLIDEGVDTYSLHTETVLKYGI